MLSLEEVRVDEFFANSQMPHGIKLTHLPTGLQVEGNCRNETSKANLQTTLMNVLGQFVASSEWAKKSRAAPASSDDENAYLREQLRSMQAQLDRLIGNKDPGPKVQRIAKPTKAKKAKGGWTAERRAAASARMVKQQADKKAAEPEPDEAELLRQQMRPPTDAPAVLPKVHQSHGSTVAVVSPESRARGYRP